MIVDVHVLKLDESAHYLIRAQGVFDACLLDMLSGVWVIAGSRHGQRITTLVGCVADQAALLGTLEQLYSLGLPILLVEFVAEDDRVTR